MSESTRIRYKKSEGGVLISPEFLAGEKLMRGVILTESSTVSVEEKVDGEYKPVKVATYKSLPLAKMYVKSELKASGVSFYEEVRERKPKGE